MTINERIKLLIESHPYSRTEIANKIGVSKQTLYKYENGIVTNIPSDKIESIALLFNVTPAYLMGWDEEKIKIAEAINQATLKKIDSGEWEWSIGSEDEEKILILNKIAAELTLDEVKELEQYARFLISKRKE